MFPPILPAQVHSFPDGLSCQALSQAPPCALGNAGEVVCLFICFVLIYWGNSR